MNDFPTLQETFDAAATIPAANLALFHDMDEVVKKHINTIKKDGLTDAVFDDYAEVAARYGVRFVHPKYTGGLKPVENRLH